MTTWFLRTTSLTALRQNFEFCQFGVRYSDLYVKAAMYGRIDAMTEIEREWKARNKCTLPVYCIVRAARLADEHDSIRDIVHIYLRKTIDSQISKLYKGISSRLSEIFTDTHSRLGIAELEGVRWLCMPLAQK